MKRLFLALGAACLFTAFGPVSVVSANWWWHHSKTAAAKAEASPKPKKAKPQKTHKEKHQRMNKPEHLYNSPKSVGWFHKSPGPMGAGSNQK